jgi:hypothetical protein
VLRGNIQCHKFGLVTSIRSTRQGRIVDGGQGIWLIALEKLVRISRLLALNANLLKVKFVASNLKSCWAIFGVY